MENYQFTEEQLRKLLEETIWMYEEYLVKHGSPKASAHLKAIQEMVEGLDAEKELAHSGEVAKPYQLAPMCGYCHTRHWGYQDHQGA